MLKKLSGPIPAATPPRKERVPYLDTDPPTSHNGLNKITTDQQSGQYALVNANRDTVTLKDKAGNTIWSTNIIEGIKSKILQGERIIRGIQVYEGDLYVSVGRGFVVVDLKTGKVKGIATN